MPDKMVSEGGFTESQPLMHGSDGLNFVSTLIPKP